MKELIPPEWIKRKIYLIRGQKVMFDKDLAILYAVTTANLNKAVTRNPGRFPDDFSFKLTSDEVRNLIFHFGTSRLGGTRKMPRVFTEQGVAMLSSVLRSERAIQVNIAIMSVFVRLREILSTHKELAHKLRLLETRIDRYDHQIQSIFDAINQLILPPEKPKRRIGFYPEP
ncbi:MAG: ORF6N domain-containing protein [Candidatus Aureabacteria bacterium]|nr:ORF6N domain-containing protein [Candidatus Auribacterota bacterium]